MEIRSEFTDKFNKFDRSGACSSNPQADHQGQLFLNPLHATYF